MGLPSVFSLSNKENCSSISLHLCCSGKRIIKKKRSQRRRSRRIPLRDITHLCNYDSLRLPSGEPNLPSPSSSGRLLGFNMKRIFADEVFKNGDGVSKHDRAAQVLRKEFR
ncbi:hypothetical protein KSP40_PGU017302 [Platanthera guangdongensis]|uniref:Uncharacterized protein n=1 Tax=Platanthera guangdongensis TaxID=2320717 RepID=A0ABR2LK14_9ASPA